MRTDQAQPLAIGADMAPATTACRPNRLISAWHVEDYVIHARLLHDILRRRAPQLALHHARSVAEAL